MNAKLVSSCQSYAKIEKSIRKCWNHLSWQYSVNKENKGNEMHSVNQVHQLEANNYSKGYAINSRHTV